MRRRRRSKNLTACGHFLKLNGEILFEQLRKSSPINSTHYAKLYPQNGDRVVSIDSVTSIHSMYCDRYYLQCFDAVCWAAERASGL